MYDRIPTPGQEGRMLISPEGGTPYYATVAMADNPTQEGTFINKATLLKDATAALFGLGAAAVPDDVHNWVGQYATHWWSVLHGKAGTGYKEARTNIDVNLAITSARGTTLSVSKYINIDQESGAISLASPTSFTVPAHLDTPSEIEPYLAELASMAPVYIFGADEDKETVFYLPEGTTYSPSFTGSRYTIYGSSNPDDHYLIVMNSGATVSAQKITSQLYNIPAGATTYVNSTNRNAYTEGTDASGNVYEYLGVPFTKATTAPKIATGTYVGTGMAGPSNPNTLTFDFVPKLVVVQSDNYSNMNFASSGMRANWVLLLNGVNEVMVAFSHSNVSSSPLAVNWSGNTVSWHHNETNPYDNSQLNAAGQTYRYFAIG